MINIININIKYKLTHNVGYFKNGVNYIQVTNFVLISLIILTYKMYFFSSFLFLVDFKCKGMLY